MRALLSIPNVHAVGTLVSFFFCMNLYGCIYFLVNSLLEPAYDSFQAVIPWSKRDQILIYGLISYDVHT